MSLIVDLMSPKFLNMHHGTVAYKEASFRINITDSVHCCLVVTCWERADRLALLGDVYCICVTFPCGILGQAWYLIDMIVSFPDLCHFFSISSCKEL